MDCISSIGAAAIDLDGVYLATGTSGKALGSYAGLGMVFYNEPVAPSDRIPRYVDIGFYASRQGVPFTLSSNLVYALAAALEALPAGLLPAYCEAGAPHPHGAGTTCSWTC